MAKKTMAKYIVRMLFEDRFYRQKYAVLSACNHTRLAKLWLILFETDVRDVEELEEQIYAFGSQMKEDDYWGREIFVFLVAFLNLVIK